MPEVRYYQVWDLDNQSTDGHDYQNFSRALEWAYECSKRYAGQCFQVVISSDRADARSPAVAYVEAEPHVDLI